MTVKIDVLVENKPVRRETAGPNTKRVSGEHGLSLLIESGKSRILFDTGAGSLVAVNADALGLNGSLADLDAIVLSHGHYDHTGGLMEVLKCSPKHTTVHVRPGFFRRKFRRKGSKSRDIGAPFSKKEAEILGAQFVVERDSREIHPGIFVTGLITRYEQWEDVEQHLCVESSAGQVFPDPFEEELALALVTAGGLVVFSGCAHRGIINSIKAAQKAADRKTIRAVFGGAHLMNAPEERIARTVESLAALEPELVALGHCTGEKAEMFFSEALGERFSPLRAGASWELGE
jgi:7,8-dihydropterin-6-yl-methyl-4-(beta-D-ribofuranosyl)aminobenzene 5'-phosphate synthase